MSISDRTLIKSKSLSLQYNRNNVRTIDRNIIRNSNDSFITQQNESNQVISRKSSFKQRIISIFKSHSVHDHGNEFRTVDNNGRNSSQADSSQSTLSRVIAPQKTTEELPDLFDIRDQQLMAELPIHQLTRAIVSAVSEQPCSTIKLPSTWLASIGPHLSNKALQPFLNSIPGILGIKNHGNTCYVNVIIQCLAHLDSVAQYFATKDYLADLSQSHFSTDTYTKTTHTSSKNNGSTGLDVLVGLSYLLQSLWQHTYQQTVSMNFCRLLSRHNTQFSIDSQQDAHELLLCVLNLLHDNLVRQRPTPSTATVDDSSFIYDRFRGSLSNEITCPRCGYSRLFRDQMLSLNLPIPTQRHRSENKQLFSIVVIDGNQIGERHAFEIDKHTTVANIRDGIAARVGCQPHDIIILELVNSGFGKLYSDNELIVDISKKNNILSTNTDDSFADGLYGVYIPNQVVDVDALPLDRQSDDEVYSSLKRKKELLDTQPFIRLLVVHVERNKEYVTEISDDRRSSNVGGERRNATTINYGQTSNPKSFVRFTNVLTVQAARKTKLGLLRHSLSEQMCKYLSLKNVTKLPKPQFIIEGSHIVSELDSFPLLHPSVTQALINSSDICGIESAVVRLVVVWPFRNTHMLRLNRRMTRDNQVLSTNTYKISLHHSVEELSVKHSSPDADSEQSRDSKSDTQITINDCLREFFSLDSVSVTESWNCPGCQTIQKAHTNIRIKQAPEILILMLKRFTNGEKTNFNNVSSQRIVTKNEMFRHSSIKNHQNGHVKTEHVPRKNVTDKKDDNLNKLECFVDYPLENLDMKAYMEDAAEEENYLYNLVGVVNHKGNLFNGHYVAMCKNSIDNRWRVYDDDRVTEITKSDVVHPNAYILFYKRQSEPTDNNPELNVHWSYRRLSFPDKIHRNQGPNPTSLYTKHNGHYSGKDRSKSPDNYVTLPSLSLSNSNSNHSLNRRLSSIYERPVQEQSILSPHLLLSSSSSPSSSSSSSSSLTRCGSSASQPLPLTPINYGANDANDAIDIATIVSRIVDLQSYSCEKGCEPCCAMDRRRVSNDESDSGTVLSQLSASPIYDKTIVVYDDECYSSLSTSPTTSSSSPPPPPPPPLAAKKLSMNIVSTMATVQ